MAFYTTILLIFSLISDHQDSIAAVKAERQRIASELQSSLTSAQWASYNYKSYLQYGIAFTGIAAGMEGLSIALSAKSTQSVSGVFSVVGAISGVLGTIWFGAAFFQQADFDAAQIKVDQALIKSLRSSPVE